VIKCDWVSYELHSRNHSRFLSFLSVCDFGSKRVIIQKSRDHHMILNLWCNVLFRS